jgi:hypothetical protein
MTTTLNRSLDLLTRLFGGQVKLIAVQQVQPKGSFDAKPLVLGARRYRLSWPVCR